MSLSSSHSHAYCLGLISYSAPLFLPLIVPSSCCLLCWVIIIPSQHHHPSSHPPSLHPLVLRIMACSLRCDGAHQSTYLERCWTLQPQTPTSDQPGSFLFPHGPLGLLEQWWDTTIAATIECKRRYLDWNHKRKEKQEQNNRLYYILSCWDLGGNFLQVSWDKLYLNVANALTFLRIYLWSWAINGTNAGLSRLVNVQPRCMPSKYWLCYCMLARTELFMSYI